MRRMYPVRDIETELLERLKKIEASVGELVRRQTKKSEYTIAEAAKILDRTEYTIRLWALRSRINASKTLSGHGLTKEWRISHTEILRIQREGILPIQRKKQREGNAAPNELQGHRNCVS